MDNLIDRPKLSDTDPVRVKRKKLNRRWTLMFVSVCVFRQVIIATYALVANGSTPYHTGRITWYFISSTIVSCGLCLLAGMIIWAGRWLFMRERIAWHQVAFCAFIAGAVMLFYTVYVYSTYIR
jgi:hypothetical protein